MCQLLGVTLCPLRRYTGIPCFTCGSTRAILALVTGDITTAFLTQPLVISLICMLAPILLFNICAALLKKRMLLLSLSRTEKTVLFVSLTVATLINWLYLLSTQ